MIDEKAFGKDRAHHLSRRTRSRRDAERQRALLVGRRAPDDGEDDAEPGAGDAEPDEKFENLVLAGRDREGGQDKAGSIENRAQHDGAAVAEPLGDRAEDRLPDAPGEVLDRDRKAEIGPEPAELFGNGNLEQAEARPDRHAEKDDEGPADEDRGEKGSLPRHAGSLTCRDAAHKPGLLMLRLSKTDVEISRWKATRKRR
jgi:hypothetical protein